MLPNIPTLPGLATLNRLPAIRPTGEGETFEFFGERATLKISGEQTDNEYALLEFLVPPGGGPPPHLHDREDEVFILQSGMMRILANGRWREVKMGDVVFAPRGHVHCFHNHTTDPCRFWLLVSPAGFENFYRDVCLDQAGLDAPHLDRLHALCERYGIHLAG
jgi:quercetin dioxygenase-like cupin family protein